MSRVISLIFTAIVGLLLLYVSRFWPFELWDRPGLFGWRELPPGGGVLQRWLRGTDFAPYDLILWFILSFLVLSALQAIFAKFQK